VDLRDEEPLIPASNMKLLTSGAALLVLGRDFVFRTELILDGTRSHPPRFR
jgi:D-alanyl-D-alanine carboxypeptidase